MAQITSGLRAVLSAPWVYDATQRLLGVARYRRALVRDHFALFPGARVLDIGCGTGELLEALPGPIAYLGVDLSAAYIERARRRADPRARFVCADVDALEPGDSGPFDRIIGTGLLHHLDDEPAARLLARAARALAPGGFLLMVDPTLIDPQPALARALIVRDRGRNVRSPQAYAALARPAFADVETRVRHDLLRVPYTHCVLRCAHDAPAR
jgi:SAM-dependent methyltransferase